MLNSIVVVGKLKSILLVGDNYEIKLSIPRQYKNEDGVYESDLITIQVSNSIGKRVEENCTPSDTIGIKGRIETDNKLIGEKVTFLSSRGNKNEEN